MADVDPVTKPEPVVYDKSKVTSEWALDVTHKLLAGSYTGVNALQEVLPAAVVQSVLEALCSLVVKESTVVDVLPATAEAPVVVVGDTHGQLHDVCAMLQQVGHPSEKQLYIFNGDFVDRGAWGLEVLMVLACWKLAQPKHVVVLRGNHECTTCTHMYGFRAEVLAKYGQKDFKDVYKVCKKVFAALPLAAVVAEKTLVLHGGLFRKPFPSKYRRKKRRKTLNGSNALEIGSLDDLRAATKGGLDPNGAGKAVVATDVMWSDPASEPGLVENEARGVGLLFGPDVTQAFLEANRLKLIIRSHEGPDARWKREGMQDMSKGHSLDHVTPGGNLVTVFSAPDYPQFQPNDNDRFNNLGAVAVLRSSQGHYTQPDFVEYPAAPRPPAEAFYEYEDVPDSDEEMSIGHGSASDLSEASSQDASALSHVTVEEDTVEASSRATDAVAPQVDAQPSSSATAVNESDDVHKTVEAESQQSQLQRDDTAAYVNGVSGGLHLNGHGQPEPAATEESRHVPTYVEASQLAQEQQRADQGHGADPAEDSGIKHQAAAVFDPQAAKEAAAADEAVGAVADEPGTAADELVQHAQENPNCNGDLNATTPVLADISKSATPGTAKPLPTRSSSRHIQSQAKTAPWR